MTTHLNRSRGLVRFRRDLRLDNNPAWAAATSAHDEVIPLFVLERSTFLSTSRTTPWSTRSRVFTPHERALATYKRALGGDAPWSR